MRSAHTRQTTLRLWKTRKTSVKRYPAAPGTWEVKKSKLHKSTHDLLRRKKGSKKTYTYLLTQFQTQRGQTRKRKACSLHAVRAHQGEQKEGRKDTGGRSTSLNVPFMHSFQQKVNVLYIKTTTLKQECVEAKTAKTKSKL